MLSIQDQRNALRAAVQGGYAHDHQADLLRRPPPESCEHQRLPAACHECKRAAALGTSTPPSLLLSAPQPSPDERRLYDGLATWCCTAEGAEEADHPNGFMYQVGLKRHDGQLQPEDPDDTACPGCGAPGQRVSKICTWKRPASRRR